MSDGQPDLGQVPVVKQTHIEASYSGPLPPPSILQQYNDIVPGAAERILRMAEQQSEHRQLLEKTVVIGDSKRADRGLICGLIVALAALGGGVFLIFTGHEWSGASIAGLDIIGLVSVFVYGTVSRRSERLRKQALMGQASQPRRS